MTDLLVWLEGTALATWTRESPSLWAYPSVLTLHTVGLAIVVGVSAVVDLRLLGVARAVPLAALRPAFPLIAVGLGVNGTTGVLLLIAAATTKAVQPVFWIKLGLIAAALCATGLARRELYADAEVAGARASVRARAIAAGSLVLWAGAIAAGRLMAYL